MIPNNSRHYGDIKMWIEKVIDSCESHDQTVSARNLILNFQKSLYWNHPENMSYFRKNVVTPLLAKLSGKQNEILLKMQ